jgi:hypothetical protein
MNCVQASFMHMYDLSLKTAAVNHPSADLLFFSKEEKNRQFLLKGQIMLVA